MPDTHRWNCLVASASVVWTQFATSSRRLPTANRFCWQFGNWPNRLHSCLTTWILIDIDNFYNDDDIMTSLLTKLSISIKIGVIKRYGVCLASFQIVGWIRRQSSWASCEFCSHRRRWHDKTVSLCRSVYWALRCCFLTMLHGLNAAQLLEGGLCKNLTLDTEEKYITATYIYRYWQRLWKITHRQTCDHL